MPLILHELIHFSLSILAALIFSFLYKDTNISLLNLSVVALLSGFFIDVDHLIDYFFAYGLKFDIKKFLKGKEFDINKKIYVLFHGYEYVIIFIAAATFLTEGQLQAYIFTFALSSLFHLIADVKINNVLPQTYSILFRLFHAFDIKKLTP